MIVLKSTYDKLKADYAILVTSHVNAVDKYNSLRGKWDGLIEELNAKGGREFIDKARIPSKQQVLSAPFGDDDLRKLLSLCHPDKHGGKKIAEEMTVKLLRMRL